MRVLVDGGDEIDARDQQGYTPMIRAVGVLSYVLQISRLHALRIYGLDSGAALI